MTRHNAENANFQDDGFSVEVPKIVLTTSDSNSFDSVIEHLDTEAIIQPNMSALAAFSEMIEVMLFS